MPNQITIFSDGASKGNPGPGGWGAVIVSNEKVKELGGFEKDTTNNRMELSAVLKALTEIKKEKKEIFIYTDSRYVINGMTSWIHGWQKNNWQTKTKTEVLNKDLWVKLLSVSQNKKIKWNYVGGHIGVAGNERCDEIASALASGEKVKLYDGPLSDYKINILDLGHSTEKKTKKSSSGQKAYSYVSLINSVVCQDKTWPECEKRVKGVKGVKYQKALSPEHEKEIIASWGH